MKSRKLLRSLALMALALFLLSSTAYAAPLPVNVEVAAINVTTKTMSPGDPLTLEVIYKYPFAANEPLSWVDSNETVASISSTDASSPITVTALKNGRATISLVGSKGTLAKCQVTVRTVKITSFTISPKSLTIAPGRDYTLTANVKPSNATFHTVSWTSSDPSVLSFDPVGAVGTIDGLSVKVYAHSVGTVTLLAVTDKGRRQSCAVTVKDLAVTSVKFPSSKITIYKENSTPTQLTAVVSPSTAAETTITYTSSVTAVADIDPATGVLTPNATGTTVITAAAGGKTGTCKVTVASKAIKSLSISTPDGADVVLDPAETAQLTANPSPAYAADRSVAWSSENDTIATVKDGLVTAASGGIVQITAYSVVNPKVKATVKIHVRGAGAYKTVTITSAGDAVLGGDQRKGSYVANPLSYQRFKAAIFELGDDDVAGDGTVFTRVAKYFGGDSNISTLNLECTLTLKDTRDDHKPFAFQGNPIYAQTMLKGYGIDAVNLANNHTYDVGKDGYLGTMRALDKKDVKYYGNGMTCYVKKNGVKVAFLGFLSKGISMGSMRTQIQNAAHRADMVVVMFHWTDGAEFKYAKPTGRQQTIAHAAISAGADLILGEHVHRLSGIERYRGKYIVYEMGNFVTVASNPINQFGPSNPMGKFDYDSMIYQQAFNIWTDGFVEPAGIKIIPCAVTSSPKKLINNAQPMPYTDQEDIDRVKTLIEDGSPDKTIFSKYPIEFTH